MINCLTNAASSAGSFVTQEFFNAPKTIVFTLFAVGALGYLGVKLSKSTEESNDILNDAYTKICETAQEVHTFSCKLVRLMIAPFHSRSEEDDFTTWEKLAGGIALIVPAIGTVALATIVFKSYLCLSVKAFDLPFVLPWKAARWIIG